MTVAIQSTVGSVSREVEGRRLSTIRDAEGPPREFMHIRAMANRANQQEGVLMLAKLSLRLVKMEEKNTLLVT